MSQAGICLVVPESLKKSAATEYAKQSNVISFHDFFHSNIVVRMTSHGQLQTQ
jgi:hypothetical protein